MSLPPPEERFKRRLLEFIEFTKSVIVEGNAAGIQTPVSPLIMDLSKAFIEKEDAGKIVTTFTIRSLKSWDKIKNRDVEYIKNAGSNIFEGVPEKSVAEIKVLQDVLRPDGTRLFNETVQEGIWGYFDSLVKLSVCYVHKERCPDPVTKKYTKNFFPDMKIKSEVERWGITKLE
jgi:hypothetical protein